MPNSNSQKNIKKKIIKAIEYQLILKKKRRKKDLENQALADPSSRMISRILFLTQIPGSHQRNRDGIPKNHLDRSGGHRSQIKRTQFPLQRQTHIQIANRRESIAFNGRHRHQIRTFRLGARNQTEQLLSVPGFAE